MTHEIPRSNTYLNLLTVRSQENTDIQIAMTLADFEYINEMCINTEEMSLAQFAETDARRAYKICKVALNDIFSKNIRSIIYNQHTIIDTSESPLHEVAAVAKNWIKTLPDEDIEKINLSINIHPSDDDIRVFDIHPNTQYELFKVHVEPPNLAA